MQAVSDSQRGLYSTAACENLTSAAAWNFVRALQACLKDHGAIGIHGAAMKPIWQRLREQKPWAKILEIEALILILIGSALVLGGKIALDRTNTLSFCISCHEMKDNNYEEYSHTIHALNRTGVKAICSDCHVPHEFVDTVVRKVRAAGDVYHHLLGTLDTKEKFEEHRLELAKRVWLRMKESDSRECRNCHDVDAMDPEKQGKTAQKQHKKMVDGSRTCIDCHFGIAHREPSGDHEPGDAIAEHD